MKDFQSLFKNTLKKTTQRQNIDDKTIFYIVSLIIKEEYGYKGVEKIIPKYYKKNTIFLTVHQSIWAQEIQCNQQKLLRKINKKLGKKILYDIKISS